MIFLSYLFFLIPVSLFAIVFLLKRLKQQWFKRELLLLVLPYGLWLVGLTASHNKSLTNFFGEPLLVGLITLGGLFTRVLFSKSFEKNPTLKINILILLVSLSGLLVAIIMPPLPA